MNFVTLLRTSVRMFDRFKLRSFFMSVGVALGVATLIAGSAIGNGLAERMSAGLDRMVGPGAILVSSRELKVEDLQAIADRMDQVVAVGGFMMLGSQEIRYVGANHQASLYGAGENGDFVWSRGVIDGRYFDEKDVERAARVALIGTGLKTLLFGDGDPVGEEIIIASNPYEVIGVLESIGIDPHGEDRDMDVYVPITTAQRRVANTDIVGNGKVIISDIDRVDDDAEEIAAILRERFNIAAGEPETFKLFTSKFAGAAASRAKQALGMYVLVASLVVLLVAAVVIASIMLISVRERIAEIGLRKAVGATPRSIAIQFLFEATIVSIIAGVSGIVLGFAIIEAIDEMYGISAAASLQAIVGAVAASVLVGVVSGIIPARRASRLDPVDALR